MNSPLMWAYCYDSATGQRRHYVRVKYWRGLWEKRVVLAEDQS